MPKVLIVENDPNLRGSLALNLKLNGFHTEEAMSVHEAWQKINHSHFELVLVDIGLPDGDGIDLCKRVRESGNDVPLFFLSSLTDETTAVRGLTSGADDYLRIPFSFEELRARMQKFIKKTVSGASIKAGALTIDPAKRLVTVMGEIITLGRKELDILILLARRAGEVVTRENIISALYENADLYDRTVDSHMSHLRKKIRSVGGNSLRISSVYGHGYRLECSTKKIFP